MIADGLGPVGRGLPPKLGFNAMICHAFERLTNSLLIAMKIRYIYIFVFVPFVTYNRPFFFDFLLILSSLRFTFVTG